MDHNEMIVSDIPLPGEAFDFKSKIETGDDAEEAEIKAEIVTTTTPTTEQQHVVVTQNEAEKIAAEFLEDITDESEETIEIITESVAELQMEVEQATMEMETPDTSINTTSNKTDNSMETLKLEESLNETTDETQQKESVINITVEDNSDEDSLNETTDETQQKETVEVNDNNDSEPVVITIEEPLEDKKDEPAKKNKRSNSTIEAIKNDWITIEEINEEISETNSPNPEPIITEPEKKEEAKETVEKPEDVSETTDNQQHIIVVETDDEIPNTDDDNNITIEITEQSISSNDETTVVINAADIDKEQQTTEEEETVEQQTTTTTEIETIVEEEKPEIEIIKVEEQPTTVEEQPTTVEEQPTAGTITVEEQPATDTITVEEQPTTETVEQESTTTETLVIIGEQSTTEIVEQQPTTEDTLVIIGEQPITEIVEQQSTTETLIIVEEQPTIETVEQQPSTTETLIIIGEQPITKTFVKEQQPQPLVVEEEEQPQIQKEKVVETTKEDIQETVEEKKQPEIKIELANNNKTVEQRRRGRPAKGIQREGDKLPIPCHVMGRNVDNPQEDLISNGRTPPKPRLGVKVPYRFLTSQIVSKEEIADELIEITNKRNPAPDPPAGGDIFFASKLTQRLATKIANASKKKTPSSSSTENKQESTSGIPNDALNNTQITTATEPSSKQKTIGDNSDLLAILEGDVDVDWTKEVRNNKTNDEETKVVVPVVTQQPRLPDVSPVHVTKKLDPEMERQIALKQLAQLPKKACRGRPRKYQYAEKEVYTSKTQEQPIKEQPIKKEVVSPPKPPVEQKVQKQLTPKTNKDTPKTPVDIKQAVTKISQKIQDNIKIKQEIDNSMDIDSDLKLNPKRAVKTYSRKETVVDISVPADLELNVNDIEPPSALPEKEKPNKEPSKTSKTVQQQNQQEIRRSKRSAPPELNLVSKRARVIKKKVIWDPAEVPKTKVLNAIRRAQAMEMKAKRQQQLKQREMDETTTDTDDEKQHVIKEKQMEVKQEKVVKQKKEETTENVRQLRKNRILNKVQKKILMKRQLRSIKNRFRSTNGELKSSIALSKKKKQVMAEIAKNVQKNRKTELDRLLSDEGAINMLYSVKTKSKNRRSKVITQRDLINRAKAVKETLTSHSEEGKALRNSTPIRKKSRDSIRSSLQSPPPSPTVSYRGIGAEASRIIRRHSSSFSSDSSTPRRLSVEQNEEPSQRVLRKKPTPTPEKKTEKLTTVEKKKIGIEMTKNFDKKRKITKKDNEFSVVELEYKEIILKKCNNVYQIVLNYPVNAKLKDSISLQMFNELNTILTKLSTDNNCKIVVLTSKGKSFCNGLDFSYLIQTTAEKRSQAALEMSKTLKEFILVISKFPKIIIASLHSSVSYLGCTILPYFDYVLSAEGATLSADYARLGQSPEGAPLISLSPKIGQTLTSELLLMGRKLTAKDALENGLINQIEKPEKLQEALVKIGEEISTKSQQSLLATKSLLRQPMLSKLEEALDLEQKLLIEHWTSSECQQMFKKLLQEQEVW